MPRLERADLIDDSKQRRDEVLEMRRQRDQELGLGLAVQRVGSAAGGDEARRKRRIGLVQCLGEPAVDRLQPLACIEIREGEAVVESQHRCMRHRAPAA